MHNEANPPHPNAVGLTVADVKRSIAFYRDKLGFELRHCWPDESNPMWASLVLDRQSVMVGKAATVAECEGMHKGSPEALAHWKKGLQRFAEAPHGVGVLLYFEVPDVDAYAAAVKGKGVKLDLPPTTQFYGLRDIHVTDPDGYELDLYTPVAMSACQSCAMPLADAKPGQMYCEYCVDESGTLRPYEQVFEGTVSGYFMAMQKMARPQAEKAAKEHLAKHPAWSQRK